MSTFYAESHEWARPENDHVVVGISEFAAGEIGEVIHAELPDVDREVKQGEVVAEIESVKSVNDIYSPVSGTIVAVNEALANAPELLNNEPTAGGWLFKVTVSGDDAMNGLLDEAAYQAHIKG